MSISPIIIALDFPSSKTALTFAKQLDPEKVRLKVGKELFVATGPKIIEQLQSLGFAVFLDLKFHDIPNTVAKACLEAAKMGVWMTNVHASGGFKMMQQVINELSALATRPLLTAVTVLTSIDQNTIQRIGINSTVAEQVIRLAKLTKSAGLDGVVCSAQEAEILRKHKLGDDFLLVTPGIRLLENNNDDQSRITTPKKAIDAGANYLVIGRPITKASNPQKVIEEIITTIQ